MELIAPSNWRRIDFVSDLHLQQQEGSTFSALKDYLHTASTDALFILGDLFEVWVGDDCLTQANSFERQCADALANAAQRFPVHIMHGNRDFLMGDGLMVASGARLLDDPTVLDWAGQRWVLTHGDALCLDDKAYQQFRAQVRSPQWQSDFLAQPLTERLEIARSLRKRSDALKREIAQYADVDTEAAIALLQRCGAHTMIHGHTHKPAVHAMDATRTRHVLSDWDAGALPPRLEVMRWTWPGNPDSPPVVERLAAANAAAPGH